MSRPAEPPLRPLELATEYATGQARSPLPIIEPPQGASPASARRALEDAVLRALQRPPCLVSFSGGLDSTAVLAVAVHAAREAGLPLPIPITWRFPGAPSTDEAEWQEAVIAELGVMDWIRRAATDELDYVGPVAEAAIRRHGLLYPANTHLHAPLLDAARGGSLLTGIGGDQILGFWRWRHPAKIAARVAPPVVHRLRAAAQHPRPPWLVRSAALSARWNVGDLALDPRRWSARVRWQASRRRLALTVQSMDLIARDRDVAAVHPLLDPAFMGAAAAVGGNAGLGDRPTTLTVLLDGLMPRAVSRRRTKATFDGVFWSTPSRRARRQWDGSGVDPDVVDPARLRELWRADAPPWGTALLLQSVAFARRVG